MGAGLFQSYRECTECADDILGYSIEALCQSDPGRMLAQTQFTQPALYVVNAMSYWRYLDTGGTRPDFLAGHSLGEFNALLAADVFGFEEGLRLVKQRGLLMGQAVGGAMAAVIGMSEVQVRARLVEASMDAVTVANINGPFQVVISGAERDVASARTLFADAQAYIRLNVSGAFHSPSMQAAAEGLAAVMEDIEFAVPAITVIANTTAQPHAPGLVQQCLRRQLCEPVRWVESIDYLLRAGVEHFEEIGPGSTLTKLIRAIRGPGASVAAQR